MNNLNTLCIQFEECWCRILAKPVDRKQTPCPWPIPVKIILKKKRKKILAPRCHLQYIQIKQSSTQTTGSFWSFLWLTVDFYDLHIRRGEIILLTQHFWSLVGICKVTQYNLVTIQCWKVNKEHGLTCMMSRITQHLILRPPQNGQWITVRSNSYEFVQADGDEESITH